MDRLIEAERMLVDEEAVIAPVYHEGSANVIRPFIKNWVQHPTGPIEWKYARVE
jgi:oligopeptide transport system substrate-binding protein